MRENQERTARVKEFLNVLPVNVRCTLRNQVQSSIFLDNTRRHLKSPNGLLIECGDSHQFLIRKSPNGLLIECGDSHQFLIRDEECLNELLAQLV